MRHRFWLVLVTMIGLYTFSVAVAQDSARQAILGTWQGTVAYGESAPATLEFSDDAGTLKWKYSFKYDPVLWGDAAGTVTSFSPPTMELAGTYTDHAVPGARGTGVRLTLTIDGDQLKGTAIADMNGLPFVVSMTRKK